MYASSLSEPSSDQDSFAPALRLPLSLVLDLIGGESEMRIGELEEEADAEDESRRLIGRPVTSEE